MCTTRWMIAVAWLVVSTTTASADQVERNFAGSVQLDYMAVPTENVARDVALDAATVEVSLKMAQDFGEHVSASVKMCIACHGMEVGMAFFDLRVADQLNFRVGRFTPQFGSFPLRHDPANHRTSDKPLPYDMGRMVRLAEWNMGVMPSPWVDNGLEISGTHFSRRRSRSTMPPTRWPGLARPRTPSTSSTSCRAEARATTSTTTRGPRSVRTSRSA